MTQRFAGRLISLCVITGTAVTASAQERSSNSGAIGRSPSPRYIYPNPTATGTPVALEDFTNSAPRQGSTGAADGSGTRPAGPGDLRTAYPGFERPFPTGVTRHTPERGYQRPFSGTQGFQRPFSGSNGFQRPMEARPSRHAPTPSRSGLDRGPLHTPAPSVTATPVDGFVGVGGGGGSRGPSRSFGPPGLAGPDGIGTAPIDAGPPVLPQSTLQLPIIGGVSASTTVSAPAGAVITGLPGLSTGVVSGGACGATPLAVRTPTNESLSRVDVLYGPTNTLDELKPAPVQGEVIIPTPQERLVSALSTADYREAGAAIEEITQQSPEDSDALRLAAVIQMLRKEVAEGAIALEKAYVMDPTLAERPIDFKGLGIRGSDISTAQATLQRSARSIGEARSAFAAAVLQQSRGDTVVAKRFLDRAMAAGLAPELSIAMGRALTTPSANYTAGRAGTK